MYRDYFLDEIAILTQHNKNVNIQYVYILRFLIRHIKNKTFKPERIFDLFVF